MDPNTPNQPPSMPGVPPVESSPLAIPSQPVMPTRKSKLPLVIISTSAALLIVIVLAVLLVAGSSPAPKKSSSVTNATTTDQAQPASALDIEQTNNALKQDLSSLSDTQEFGTDNLSDKALSL